MPAGFRRPFAVARAGAGFCLVAALAAARCGGNGRGGAPVEPRPVRCEADAGPCVAAGPGSRTVSFEISPRPVRSVADLTFRVGVRGAQGPAADPDLDLELRMPGMVMGTNRVVLLPAADGGYAGRGTIVRCLSGRRDWEAVVSGPSLGTVRFAFEVDRP